MGLFDAFKKKDCEICGKEVGLFGYKKLEDGEICKDCVKLLSPWFDDRRHSTVEQIKQQLSYREENRAALNAFRPTVAYGERYTLRAEIVNGVPTRFVIERGDNYKEENADIVNFKDVTSFHIDVQEHNREIKCRNSQGEEVSYRPPRYEYSYDFYAEINVNHPYFNEMRFQVNRDTLNLETVDRRPGLGVMRTGFDPTLYPEYRQIRSKCDELEELFRAGMQGMVLNGAPVQQQYGAPVQQQYGAPVQQQYGAPVQQQYGAPVQQQYVAPVQPVPAAPQAPAGPKFCPNCGAPSDGGKFCQSCGSRL